MGVEEHAAILSRFSSDCLNMEGGHVVSFTNQTSFISMDLDWISRSDGGFVGNVIDPLGRTVAEFTMQGSNFSFSSKMNSPLSLLGVNSIGYLTFDRQSSYVKTRELSCLLKGLVPENWLASARGSSLNWETSYRDSERKIVVTNASKDICGEVSPSGIMGWLVKSIHFCTNPRRGQISWGDQFRLEWRSLDEPGS